MFEDDDDDEDTDLIDNAYAAVKRLIALTPPSEHKKVALNILKEEIARAEAKKEEEKDDDEDKEDDDEDDGWEQIYNRIPQYWDDDLKIYGSLYETYGGGPAGGYIWAGVDTIFAWHQDWGTKKQYTKLDGKRLEFKTDDHGIQFVKVVDDTSDEEEINEDFNKT